MGGGIKPFDEVAENSWVFPMEIEFINNNYATLLSSDLSYVGTCSCWVDRHHNLLRTPAYARQTLTCPFSFNECNRIEIHSVISLSNCDLNTDKIINRNTKQEFVRGFTDALVYRPLRELIPLSTVVELPSPIILERNKNWEYPLYAPITYTNTMWYNSGNSRNLTETKRSGVVSANGNTVVMDYFRLWKDPTCNIQQEVWYHDPQVFDHCLIGLADVRFFK